MSYKIIGKYIKDLNFKIPNPKIFSLLSKNISDYKILLGSENRDMTDVELLNRDYYQGRFASKDKDGNYIFNWEEQNVH